MERASYFRYWGKAKREPKQSGPDYHLLAYHCLDVAAVGWLLLEPTKPLCQKLAQQLEVEPVWLQQWFCFCLALHDLGKFARAFQGQVTGLSDCLVEKDDNLLYHKRHDSLGFALWDDFLDQEFLNQVDCDVRNSYFLPWLKIVTGHHGCPPEQGLCLDFFFTLEDKQAAKEFVFDVYNQVFDSFDLSPLAEKQLSKRVRDSSWLLAGVAVLADWLGSEQKHFVYLDKPGALKKYWHKAVSENAFQALEQAEVNTVCIEPFKQIIQLFPFIKQPTPLQKFAIDVDIAAEPQLFILEDVTGAGKTEAALILAHRLLSKGLAKGLYIALPTMATSNGMYRRMAKAYRNLFTKNSRPSLVLAHGASKYLDEFTETIGLQQQINDLQYDENEMTASAYCSAWVADSRKKSLLADVGVGTLDQALLTVLPARHQSLRALGLKDKVLVVDEVHAYDTYMQKLLEALLEFHVSQGGSVILLSATIPFFMRQGLTQAYLRGRGKKLTDGILSNRLDNFPLVTHLPATTDKAEQQVATRKEVERTVIVKRLSGLPEVTTLINQAVKQGKCVCWVRNTVDDAKQGYQALTEGKHVESQKLTLFHSRFAMIDRQQIESTVLDIFGKGDVGEGAEKRKGQVLVATQVVEQSLDLDFDLMITDVAPIDLIIQRAGRLLRHKRDKLGNLLADNPECKELRGDAVLYLYSPEPTAEVSADWLKPTLPKVEYVYPNLGRLWLSAKVLLDNHQFSMPTDARKLIEDVYGEDYQDKVPDPLIDACLDDEGKDSSERQIAKLNLLKIKRGYCQESAEDSGGWADDIHIPTRLADETYTVALAKIKNGKLAPYAEVDKPLSHQWILSCTSLREKDWKAIENKVADQWQAEIEELKQQHKFLKWIEVLPLEGGLKAMYSKLLGWNSL